METRVKLFNDLGMLTGIIWENDNIKIKEERAKDGTLLYASLYVNNEFSGTIPCRKIEREEMIYTGEAYIKKEEVKEW